ncbi:MAG: DUF2953 domain-containing protein [Lachnospiraceae bacterium]|nr:DUF2953 domain-containing protein [Lachnospiraceae bacterium]
MIFLEILKVIGIILLILLALILFILLVVLFVPIRYRADGNYENEGNKYVIHAKANWILHIIRIRFDLNKEGSDKEVKVLFFKVYPKPEEASGVLGERKAPEDFSDDDEDGEEGESGGSVLSKIKYKISVLYVKIKRIVYMLNDERDHEAVRELIFRVVRLLKHIRPRKLESNLKLGLDDPASTGEALGLIYSFYPVYTKHLKVEPYFDRKIIEADLFLKGYIQLFFVLWAAGKIYFNKDIRRLYRQIQRIRGE